MLSDLWSDIRYRLRALFRRADLERELSDELQFHLDREAEKLRKAGRSPEEARRLARVEFGGVERTKEESRDARGISWVQVVSQDLRYAARSLRKSPGFTVAVVGTLALGIGANAAMFGIVDQLMFRAPPLLRDPASVHRVYLVRTERGQTNYEDHIEYTRYLDFQKWTSSFASAAAVFQTQLAVGIGDDTREMPVGAISATTFDFFDAPPALGRYFQHAEDSVPSGVAVAVLSYPYWQARYGGRPDVLGQRLQVGPLSYTIIGVAARGFSGIDEGAPPAVFIPITSFAAQLDEPWISDPTEYYLTYHWGWMEMVVRRKPGISTEAASADLTQAFEKSYQAERAQSRSLPPASVTRPHAIAGSVLAERGPNQTTVTKVATWVTGVAIVVLLIACANVANLLLARALRRRREIGLRLALGVSRGRLLSQLLTESLVLAAMGGVAGLGVAYLGGTILRTLFLGEAARTSQPVDWRTVGFAALAAALAGILTGLAPILQARRTDVATTLKIGAREGTYQRSRLRGGLLLVQGALSVMLLVGAGLFVRSLERVRSLRMGYDVDHLEFVSLNLRGVRLSKEQRAELARRAEETAAAIPGVEGVSRVLTIPFWLQRSTDLFVAGIDSVERLGHFTLQAGSPSYFGTTGTRILRGRGIEREDRAGTPPVTVVSEAMAAILWPGKDPIGQCMRVDADTMPCTTVVGIAENIKQRSIADDPGLHYYLSADQYKPEEASLFVRVKSPGGQREAVRKRLQQLMPGTAYVTVLPLEEIVNRNVRSWELGATMFLAFGALALVLAAIGLYSVIAYNVVQRTQELGLRIALGARMGDLFRLVVAEGVRFAILGVLAGGGIALLAGRWLGPLLYQQSPRDPVVFLAATGVLVGAAILASMAPALRAGRVDPNVALRSD